MKTTAHRRGAVKTSLLCWDFQCRLYGSDQLDHMVRMFVYATACTVWWRWIYVCISVLLFGLNDLVFGSNGSLNLQSGIGILKSRIWNLTFQVLKFHVSQGLIWSSILEFNSGIWNLNWKYKHQCYAFTKLVRWKNCIHNISYEMHFDFSIKKHKSLFCTRSIPPYKRTFSFMSNVPSER